MEVRKNLQITHPEIALEWDYEKNQGLKPEDVSKGQKKKVFWKCSEGHSYVARIDHRCSMHSGCPYCAGKAVLKGENDLKTVYPEIAAEWDYDRNTQNPEDYLPFSNKSVSWICPLCGGSYRRKIIERTNKGFGCSQCLGEKHTSRQEQTIFYYLSQTTKAENRVRIDGKEVDVYLPELGIGIEYNGEYYHKDRSKQDGVKIDKLAKNGVRVIVISCGRERALLNDQIILKTNAMANPTDGELVWGLRELFKLLGLPEPDICLRRDMVEIYGLYIKSIKENSVAVCYPVIAQEWDYLRNGDLKPESFSYASGKRVWWKCSKCGLSYDMIISHRTISLNNCPYCAGKRIAVGINDLATTHPELMSDWDYELNEKTPQSFSKGSDYKARWKCSVCGYKWSAAISSRTSGVGCPLCAGKVTVPGVNDFATQYPDEANLWNYRRNAKQPCEYQSYSNKKVWWRCDQCDYEWQATIDSITRGRRCPECAQRKRVIAHKEAYRIKNGSLAERYPDLLKEWNYEKNGNITPSELTGGSKQKVWWICNRCGNEWQAVVYSRVAGRICPECARKNGIMARKETYRRKNGSLSDNHPELLMEWDYDKNVPLLPENVTSGMSAKVWWRCSKCSNQWEATIYSRSTGRGCPECAKEKRKK